MSEIFSLIASVALNSQKVDPSRLNTSSQTKITQPFKNNGNSFAGPNSPGIIETGTKTAQTQEQIRTCPRDNNINFQNCLKRLRSQNKSDSLRNLNNSLFLQNQIKHEEAIRLIKLLLIEIDIAQDYNQKLLKIRNIGLGLQSLGFTAVVVGSSVPGPGLIPVGTGVFSVAVGEIAIISTMIVNDQNNNKIADLRSKLINLRSLLVEYNQVNNRNRGKKAPMPR